MIPNKKKRKYENYILERKTIIFLRSLRFDALIKCYAKFNCTKYQNYYGNDRKKYF